MAKKITLTKTDHERLTELVSVVHPQDPDAEAVKELRTELARAEIVDPKKVDADIVTMNSRVLIQDLDTGEEKEYTLVYPLAADISQGRISVMVPLGRPSSDSAKAISSSGRFREVSGNSRSNKSFISRKRPAISMPEASPPFFRGPWPRRPIFCPA